jgi:hypothetical protein
MAAMEKSIPVQRMRNVGMVSELKVLAKRFNLTPDEGRASSSLLS